MTKCRAPTCNWPATTGFHTCSAHRYLETPVGDRATSWPFIIILCVSLAIAGGLVAHLFDGDGPRAGAVDTASGAP